MKKAIAIIGIFCLFGGLLITGCSGKKEQAKSEKVKNKIVKPVPNKITPVQAKHPLPKDSEPFTGKVVKVEGQKVIVDVKGATLEFVVNKDTNLQKGSKAFGGKLAELKPGLEVNCLVKSGKALAVAYK